MNLKNQHVVVIGGASGIGYEIAKAARAEGATVTIGGRNRAVLDHALATLGNGIVGETIDVTRPDLVNEFFSKMDKVDHIAITAAHLEGAGALSQMAESDLRLQVDVRLMGATHVIRAAASKLSPLSSVTLTSGLAVSKPLPNEALGAAAAAALECLARTLAVEMAPVRFNVVAPGMCDTGFLRRFLGAQADAIISHVAASLPVKRIGTPEEVAQAYLYLMKTGYITGETLHIDGGHRLI